MHATLGTMKWREQRLVIIDTTYKTNKWVALVIDIVYNYTYIVILVFLVVFMLVC